MNNAFEYGSVYDTQRIEQHIKNEKRHSNHFTNSGNLNIAENFSEMFERHYIKLMDTIVMDEDFIHYFTEIKEKENLFQDFSDMDNIKKIEILMRIWFLFKTKSDKINLEFNNLKEEYERGKEKQDILNKANIDRIKEERNQLQYIIDNNKLKLEKYMENNEKLEKENKSIQSKVEKLKNSKSDYDRELMKAKQERIELENYLQNEIILITKDFEVKSKELEDAKLQISDLEFTNNLLLNKNEDFKNNYEILSNSYKEIEARNKNLEKMTRKMNPNSTSYETITKESEGGGIALENIYCTNMETNKPEVKKDHKKEEDKVFKVELDMRAINKLSVMNENKKVTVNMINMDAAKKILGKGTEEYSTSKVKDMSKVEEIMAKHHKKHGSFNMDTNNLDDSINENSEDEYSEPDLICKKDAFSNNLSANSADYETYNDYDGNTLRNHDYKR